MKKILLIAACLMGLTTPAYAVENPNSFAGGMQLDVSAPSGAALGAVFRLPYLPWFKVGIAGTATLMPGIRGNLLFDPLRFPVVPLLNVDIGYQFPFQIPTVHNSPSIGFKYTDLQGGLGFGNRDGFRFMLLGGLSYLSGDINNLQGSFTTPGLTVANAHFNGWLPSAKVGFNVLF